MCYVGKATKIFIAIVAIMTITGLLLAFHWVRRGQPKAHTGGGSGGGEGNTDGGGGSVCVGGISKGCSPPASYYPQPFPANTAGPPSLSPPMPNTTKLAPLNA